MHIKVSVNPNADKWEFSIIASNNKAVAHSDQFYASKRNAVATATKLGDATGMEVVVCE